ncbi:MAG: flagellar assembly peptidoglycan hydrolase FlgJ [Nitrosospira sp.]|nr:flagellar assembly peptidoglycan hydrolase FlgJ [Nitrosospira sp.]
MVTSADLSGKFALDVQAVDGLRFEAKRTDKAGLETAAKQFESLFMNMMLKSMRQATSQDSMMDSDQTRLYTSMLDQQLSQSMASRGIGLADMMVRQLSGGAPPGSAQELGQEAVVSAPAPVSSQSSFAGSPAAPPQKGGTQPLQPQVCGPAPQMGTVPPQSLQPLQPLPSQRRLSPQTSNLTPQPIQLPPVAVQSGPRPQVAAFQSRLMPHAVEVSQATGVPARFMLGQAALESGWGKREIRTADGTPSYNLFGIKAGSSWKGSVVETVTTEYVNGVAQKSVEKFRAYSSYADAFRDYVNLLSNNPRYAGVMAQAAQGMNAESFAQGLQRAGYATDPNYADKLSRIIKTTQWS